MLETILAALIGILTGIIAYLLYDLIGLLTNLAYYHQWSFHFRSPENTAIGPWIIVTPVNDPGRLVGYLNGSNLLRAWTRQLEEEGVRDDGWLSRWSWNRPSVKAGSGGKAGLSGSSDVR